MSKFEKEFVHFMWSDELEGKKVFYADDIPTLIKDIANDDDRGIAEESGVRDEPFEVNGHSWRFVYYDHNYELKRAYEQGKKIECKRKGDAWEDWNYTPAPAWLDDHEYRIMPEEQKPVTNRELAFWLVRGYGQIYHHDDAGFRTEVKTSYSYHQEEDNCDCNVCKTLHCKIRKWGDTEWVTPTREYMGLEE